jgi:hypothetical protein
MAFQITEPGMRNFRVACGHIHAGVDRVGDNAKDFAVTAADGSEEMRSKLEALQSTIHNVAALFPKGKDIFVPSVLQEEVNLLRKQCGMIEFDMGSCLYRSCGT